MSGTNKLTVEAAALVADIPRFQTEYDNDPDGIAGLARRYQCSVSTLRKYSKPLILDGRQKSGIDTWLRPEIAEIFNNPKALRQEWEATPSGITGLQRKFGVSKTTIRKKLKAIGIEVAPFNSQSTKKRLKAKPNTSVLDDVNWLAGRLNVTNIRSIARELGVDYGTVASKVISSGLVVQPHDQLEIKRGDKTDHTKAILADVARGDSRTTVAKRYGTTKAYVSATIAKASGVIYPRTNIRNPEWLIQQHHQDNKSIHQIAVETGTQDTTVKTYLTKHEIEAKLRPGKCLSAEQRVNLESYQWWVQQLEMGKSVLDVCRELDFSEQTIRPFYRKVCSMLPQHPSEREMLIFRPDAYYHLRDPQWLKQQHHVLNKSAQVIATELDVAHGTVREYLSKTQIEFIPYTGYRSIDEIDLYNQLTIHHPALRIEVCNRSLIAPLELDILFPERNVAIEMDGAWWHSFNHTETNMERTRHAHKVDACEHIDVKLLQIWDWEWHDPIKREIWLSMIGHVLGFSPVQIGARKCKIVEVAASVAKGFYHRNHLLGAKYGIRNFGLTYDDKLVMMMSFSYRNDVWEIERIATQIGHSVPGGVSKLWQHFLQEHHPTQVITFADRRHSSGKVYRQLGFQQIGVSRPNYCYFDPTARPFKPISRQKCMKHKLVAWLSEYDDNLSEAENMFANNFRRLWDSGHLKFQWRP